MAVAFGLGAVAYWLLGSAGTAPWAFVIFAALIFLTWGEIYSLFPSSCTDSFGPKFATVNLSLLYTAKNASAFLVPLANVIKAILAEAVADTQSMPPIWSAQGDVERPPRPIRIDVQHDRRHSASRHLPYRHRACGHR